MAGPLAKVAAPAKHANWKRHSLDHTANWEDKIGPVSAAIFHGLFKKDAALPVGEKRREGVEQQAFGGL